MMHNTIFFFGKNTTPNTANNYEWGYRVQKGDHIVDVQMLDTRSPKNFKFGGVMPPPLSAWTGKGWAVISQFERPVEGSWRAPAGMVRQRRLGLRTAAGGEQKRAKEIFTDSANNG